MLFACAAWSNPNLLVSPEITATATGPHEVQVSWMPADGETRGYEVIRSTVDYPNWLHAMGTVAANVYSFTDRTAQPCTAYNYAVTPIYLQTQFRGMDYQFATVTTPPEISGDAAALPEPSPSANTVSETVAPTTTNQQTTSQQPEKVTHLAIGENTMSVNGQTIVLDVSPKVENGRALVPLRAISEALGAEVIWNQETQTITVIQQ